MSAPKSSRWKLWLSLVAGAGLLAGCIPKNIIWSPDGKTAALLSSEGLYLCDSNGVLSSLVATDVVAAAWYPDSSRLAVARTAKQNSWRVLVALLPPERRARIEREADQVLTALKAGKTLEQAAEGIVPSDGEAIGLKLKETPGAREVLGTNWAEVEKSAPGWQAVQVINTAAAKPLPSPPLVCELDEIKELRISPDGQSLAYVIDTTERAQGMELKVVGADERFQQPGGQTVDSLVGQFPDWTPDSRALVYIKAVGVVTNSDELRLASLTRRGITKPPGALLYQIQDQPEEVVATIFHEQGKVRCLADGRILFSGIEAHLPCSAAGMPKRQQLFSCIPGQDGDPISLIPPGDLDQVPRDTSFFEVDPTGRRVSLVDKGLVVVLDLATGAVEKAPQPINDDVPFLPVWRGPNELCYAMSSGSGPTQAALWTPGQSAARVISQNWPEAVHKGLLDK